MNHRRLIQLDPPSVRLALSYVAIIMVLSIGFSLIFYQTSTKNLNIHLQSGSVTGGDVQVIDGPSSVMTFSTENPGTSNTIGGSAMSPVTPANISSLNAQLAQHMTDIRNGLKYQLVLLNLGALVFGAMLSYYLARRTLRPIEAAMDIQTRFASDASHELRTPLTVIQTEIEVALHKPNLTLERAKEALRSNLQEVTRLKQLSEGLLRLAHTSATDSIFSTVALDQVVSEAINQLIKPAQDKQITVTDAVPKLFVQGDESSLVQTAVILLDNAIKYSPAGSAVHVEGKSEGRHVLLSVRDEGPGIRAMDLPHVFERFYRADASRSKQNVTGYGLGLSIAQKIIQQHHGDITVSSTLEQGSIFTIKLPA
jgi:signal transduction histidine kinase